MNDNGFDLIVYLLLTVGASILGWVKSSKDKKTKTTHPEGPLIESEQMSEEDDAEDDSEEPNVIFPEPVFAAPSERVEEPVANEVDENGYDQIDRDRYAMLELLKRRDREKKVSLADQKGEEKNKSVEEPTIHADYEFDIRQAIISSEILNRKY